MIVQCDQCQTRFRVPEDRVPAEGTHVRCSKCHSTFWFTPPQEKPTAGPGVEVSLPARPQMAPAPPQAEADSWFEIPQYTEEESAGRIPLDIGPSEPQPTEKHDLQFRDSWWGTNSLEALMKEEGLTFEALAEASGGDPRPTLASPAPILGDVEDDLSTSSLFDPSYPDLVTKRPQDVKLEVPQPSKPSLPAAPQAILGPDEPPAFDGAALASVKQPAEFLLLDHAQQREDLWFTIAPLAVRGTLLLTLLFGFTALWTALDSQPDAAAETGSFEAVKRTFLGTSSPWDISQVKLQQVPLRKRYLLIITGKLRNSAAAAKTAPDIQILTTPATSPRIQQPCCQLLSAKELATFRHRAKQSAHFAALARKRPLLKPGESKAFTLLLMPKKPLQAVELKVIAPRAHPKPARRAPAPRPRPTPQPDKHKKTKKNKRRKKTKRSKKASKRRKKQASKRRKKQASKRRKPAPRR